MWTNRFFTEFRDDDQGLWRVDIQAPDYSGAPVRLTPAGDPLEWMSNGSESQTDNMIGSTGTLRLVIDSDAQTTLFAPGGVLPNSALSRRVIVTREGVTVWVGYIQMQSFSQDWESAPVEIELPLMDTVEALNCIYIGEDETAQTTMSLFRHAYRKALQGDAGAEGYEVGGVSLTDFARCDTSQYWGRTGPSVSKVWSDAAVFPGYYVGPEKDGERKTYSEAIAQILSPIGRLSQIGARWFICKYHTSTAGYYFKPNPAKPNKWEATESAIVTDISNAVAGSDNNQSVLQAPSKMTATYMPEEGAVDYSGDTICEFRAENIKSYMSSGQINVQWTDTGDSPKSHHLRYMCIGDGISGNTLDWPVTVVDRSHFRVTWRVTSHAGGTQDRVVQFFGGGLFDRPWRQALNNEEGWKVSEAQCYCMKCNLNTSDYGQNCDLQGDIVTLAIDRELASSDIFVLALKFNMKIERLTDEASFAGSNDVWQPMVQLYWSKERGGTPTAVYDRNTYDWKGCDGYFFPDSGHDATMIRYGDVKDERIFSIKDGCGYLSIRIYSSGWLANGDTMSRDYPHWHNCDNPDTFFVMTGFKLAYTPYVDGTQNRLLAWDKSFRDEQIVTYNSGMEELSLQFKTLAGMEPTPDAFLAPRWGYNDYPKSVVTKPREMLDIDAVQVTQPNGISGVTHFSLFRFNDAVYFPAAVGVNARDNTVHLKLIRTLSN